MYLRCFPLDKEAHVGDVKTVLGVAHSARWLFGIFFFSDMLKSFFKHGCLLCFVT